MLLKEYKKEIFRSEQNPQFESDCNTAIGQEMMELMPVLFLLLIFQRHRYRAV